MPATDVATVVAVVINVAHNVNLSHKNQPDGYMYEAIHGVDVIDPWPPQNQLPDYL